MKPYSVSIMPIYIEENGMFCKIYRRITNYLPYMYDLSPDERKKVVRIEEVKREIIFEDEYKEGKDWYPEPISHTEPPENY